MSLEALVGVVGIVVFTLVVIAGILVFRAWSAADEGRERPSPPGAAPGA